MMEQHVQMSWDVRESKVLVADEMDWRGFEEGEMLGADVFGVLDRLHADVVHVLIVR